MVRLVSLSLLAVFAGVALAQSHSDQQVLTESSQLADWDYYDCGAPEDAVQIDWIQLSPDPPKPGHDLTVTVSGTATETIKEGAYADVTVKIGLIKLLTRQFDVCEEARAANASVQCPLERGHYVVSHTVALPREIPPAKFKVEVDGHTVDGNGLLCLNLQVDFRKKFPFLQDW